MSVDERGLHSSSLALALSVCLFTWGPAQGAFARAQAGGLEPGRRLNVLFLVNDQHNHHALGCGDNGYGGLSTSLTPNLDRLAARGVRFERAYVPTAQCCPTRMSLITGRWPHNHGLRMNSVWGPRGGMSLPALARRAGYATATIGKHHFYWLDQLPLLEDLGFDLILDADHYSDYCHDHGRSIHSAPGNHWALPNLPRSLEHSTGFTFNENEFHRAGYMADRAIEFLEARAADQRPFLCYLVMYDPHTPILPTGPASPEDWAHLYQPASGLALPPNLDKLSTTARLSSLQAAYGSVSPDQWREVLSYYYGLITQVDSNLGRVLSRLDQLGLARNTLVVFTADHGEMGSEMSTWTKGAGSYDALTRVPLILSLPGVLPAGGLRRELVSTLDLVPTLLELTGIPIEDADSARLDGRSLVDVMLDRVPDDWRTVVFNEYGTSVAPGALRTRMARDARYKYSYDEKNGGEEELYDLESDPWEIENRIDDTSPEIQAALQTLRAALALWWNDELGHAPEYLEAGDETAPPTPATQPLPASGATGVARDVNPGWLPSSAAETQLLYLGTEPDQMPLFRELAAGESRANLGTLRSDETYYWRVDQLNANGLTSSETWSFQTEKSAAFAPGLARRPVPAQRSLAQPLDTGLAWTPGKGALTQALWLGPAGELQLVATLTGRDRSFLPQRLEAGRVYEWRVDSLHPQGSTEGDVWRFETEFDGLPARPEPLFPRHMDEAAQLAPGVGLSWSAGQKAGYKIYFGQELPLSLRATQTRSSFDPGPLAAGETYYWRVDAVNARGTSRGFTWRFTTAP